jgi:hypothetical protein
MKFMFLHTMGFLENDMDRKYGHDKASFYHILCQGPAFARHRTGMFGSASQEVTDIQMA